MSDHLFETSDQYSKVSNPGIMFSKNIYFQNKGHKALKMKSPIHNSHTLHCSYTDVVNFH